tara:strand:+ start:1676 stop:2035 length:360 start_codon:yes stop_codon:yes gene_type:complete
MTEKEFVDYSSVRDLLLDAINRRGEISYEQTMALQHAEWRASAGGNPAGLKTDPEVFNGLLKELAENEKLSQHPEICSKIAEVSPMTVAEMRVIIASKRIAMSTEEVEEVITIVRQHVL